MLRIANLIALIITTSRYLILSLSLCRSRVFTSISYYIPTLFIVHSTRTTCTADDDDDDDVYPFEKARLVWLRRRC